MRFRLAASLVLCSILLVLPADDVKGTPTPLSLVSSLLAQPKVTQLNADSYSVQLTGVVALTLVAVIYAFAARAANAKRTRLVLAQDHGEIKSDHSGQKMPLAATSSSYAPSVRRQAARAGRSGRQLVDTKLETTVAVHQPAISTETAHSLATAHQRAWRHALHPQPGRNAARADASANATNGYEKGSVPDQEPWSVYFQSGFSLN